MTIDVLRFSGYVKAAIEQGSFRQAALALNVEESTISRKIRFVEQELGLQLFERRHDGVRLTDIGREWAEEVLPRYDELCQAVLRTSVRASETEKLHIGLSAPVGREFLIRLIDRF